MMMTELFLQEARPVAVAIATTVIWFTNFTVALAFPYILVRGGRVGKRRGGGDWQAVLIQIGRAHV